MPHYYNDIAGRNLDRLVGLSDGIFAFAMTLLALNLHIPTRGPVHSEQGLLRAMMRLGPHLVPYIMSFLTLGIFWIGQQAQLNALTRSNREFAWIHVAFLVSATLIPFSTALLAEFLEFRTALLIYWLNIVLLGGTLLASWKYAQYSGLVKPDVPAEVQFAIDRRIYVGQALYAFGAALCVFNTWWSICFIVAVQVQYALAPRIRPFVWL
jgi:uncharacterized membrane protein